MNNHFVSIIRRCELSYVRGEMEKYGLIPLEGRLIRILKDKSCSQDDLAEYLNLDKGRIAKNLASLEEKGLVCRRINEKDRRQKFVSLTEKGEEIYEHIRDIYKSWTKSATPAFPGRNSLYIRTTSNELQPMRLHTEKKEEVKW